MSAHPKVDLWSDHRSEYQTPDEPVLLRIPSARYLAIDGRGPPGQAGFQSKLRALFPVVYTVKMAEKAAGRDFRVMMLEGLWWGLASPGAVGSARAHPSWRLMIRVPPGLRPSAVRAAGAALRSKGKGGLSAEVRLRTEREGRCVQMLHTGPYSSETATIERMRAFASAHGLALTGPHHEIYLSDPRRVPPSRLRTILRMPVRPHRRRPRSAAPRRTRSS